MLPTTHQLLRALPACLAVSLLLCGCGCGAEAPAAPLSTPSADTTRGAVPPSSTSTGGSIDAGRTPTGAKLRFKTLTKDFGAVDDTDELRYDFEFTNEGDQTLRIAEVKPSCGCTTTELKEMVYEPGEGGAIELLFHPKGYGPQIKTITVKSNSAGSERIIVRIKSVVTPFVQFEPRSVRFAEVPSVEGREEEVRVTCRDSTAVFGSPQCTNPNFEVEWTEPPENGTGKFIVRLKPGAPRGNVINKVKLDVQGTPMSGGASIRHHASFTTSAAVFGEIIIDPVFLSVGRIDPGGRIDKSVDLKRPQDKPFKILAMELKNAVPPSMELSKTPKGAGWTIRVTGDTGSYQGLVRGTVVLTTDVPEDSTLTIAVMGAVRPDPKK